MHGQKKKKWGKICLFFADERYLRLSKICSYPMCIICIRRGSNIAIAANVRIIT